MPRLDLEGASAIVTGGASGIGEAAARQLADLGVHVVIADLNADKGEALAAEIKGMFVKCDVSSEADGQAAVAAASDMGPLRVLVNSAGIGWAARTVDRENNPAPLGDFEKVVKINLIGSFNMLRLAAAAIAKTEPITDDGQRGVIVNLTSVAAFDGQIGQAAYSASKGGIVGMTLPLARDLAAVGVRVNTIAPGLIDTPIYGSGEQSEQFKERLKRDVVFPDRLGYSEEFASLALELVTNSYMNGETVRLDGAARLAPK